MRRRLTGHVARGILGDVRVDTGESPIAAVVPAGHTRAMDVALTKITDTGLLAIVTLPVIAATLLVVFVVWTGLAGWIARLLEDLRVLERMWF